MGGMEMGKVVGFEISSQNSNEATKFIKKSSVGITVKKTGIIGLSVRLKPA
jgi:hypothetical protein